MANKFDGAKRIAGNIIYNIAGKTSEKLSHSAYSAAASGYDKAIQAVEVAGSVKNNVKDAAERIKDAATDTSHKIGDKARGVAENISQKVMNSAPVRKAGDALDNAAREIEREKIAAQKTVERKSLAKDTNKLSSSVNEHLQRQQDLHSAVQDRAVQNRQRYDDRLRQENPGISKQNQFYASQLSGGSEPPSSLLEKQIHNALDLSSTSIVSPGTLRGMTRSGKTPRLTRAKTIPDNIPEWLSYGQETISIDQDAVKRYKSAERGASAQPAMPVKDAPGADRPFKEQTGSIQKEKIAESDLEKTQEIPPVSGGETKTTISGSEGSEGEKVAGGDGIDFYKIYANKGIDPASNQAKYFEKRYNRTRDMFDNDLENLQRNGTPTVEQISKFGEDHNIKGARKIEDLRKGRDENLMKLAQNGPTTMDWVMGNHVPQKAIGAGLVYGAGSMIFGNGQKSNAELYSNPFS